MSNADPTDGMTPSAVPEIPNLDEILRLAESDLDACRSFVGRVLGTRDALRAAATTVTVAALGLTVANRQPAVARWAAPVIVLLALGEARQEISLRLITAKIKQVERIFDVYVTALRETGEQRAASVRRLRGRIDAYPFGVERTLHRATLRQYVSATGGRGIWYLFLVLVALLLAASSWIGNPRPNEVCIQVGAEVLRFDRLPEVRQGSITVVPCAVRP